MRNKKVTGSRGLGDGDWDVHTMRACRTTGRCWVLGIGTDNRAYRTPGRCWEMGIGDFGIKTLNVRKKLARGGAPGIVAN